VSTVGLARYTQRVNTCNTVQTLSLHYEVFGMRLGEAILQLARIQAAFSDLFAIGVNQILTDFISVWGSFL
jgi:hypothetical protein